MVNKNKRSISAFISLILIISLAIAIATFVINWYTGYLKTTSEDIGKQTSKEVRCGISVSISIPYDDGLRVFCYNSSNNHLKFTLTNGANVDLSGLTIKLKNSTYSMSITLTSSNTTNFPMGKAVTRFFDIDINESLDWVEDIELIPIIQIETDNVMCVDNVLTIYGLRSC